MKRISFRQAIKLLEKESVCPLDKEEMWELEMLLKGDE